MGLEKLYYKVVLMIIIILLLLLGVAFGIETYKFKTCVIDGNEVVCKRIIDYQNN